MPLADSNLLVILGATASGKTRLGVELARRLDGEVVSADSRQVYRGMDLGTGKDLAEYGPVPRHLLDVVDPGAEFSLFHFQQRFYEAFAAIAARGRLPLLVGGTGLYLDAVLRGYRLVPAPENPGLRAELARLDDDRLRARLLALRPDQHNRTDLENRERLVRAIEIATAAAEGGEAPEPPSLRPLVLGLHWERAELRRRIAARLQQRLELGMIDEVRDLHAQGISWQTLDFYGLEYRFIARHLQGQLSRNDLEQHLAAAIANFAKRQLTFFRRMERQGVMIHWLEGAGRPLEQALELVAR